MPEPTPPTASDPAPNEPAQPTAEPNAGEPPKADPPQTEPNEPDAAGGFKSEESKKAVLADLAKEREARKALEARFEKLGEAFGVAKPEGGKTDIESLTERLENHENELSQEREARWRAEVANEKQLTAEQASELKGKTRDELAAHADRLKTLFTPTADPNAPKSPAPDPSQGARGPVDANAQIKEAEEKGDVKTAIALKSRQLSQISTK